MFGGLRLSSGRRTIDRFQTRKAGALLSFLALNLGRKLSRDEVAELLWPETEPESARMSLRTALSSLRRQLEPPGVPSGVVLITDRTTVQLNPQAVSTDVSDFLSIVREASSEPDETAALQNAIELYSGPLLPEYYEPWLDVDRDRFAQAYLGAIRRLVRNLVQAQQFERAIQYGQRAVAADTLSEEAHRDLMSLYALAGRPTAALQQYGKLRQILREELQAEPSSRTRKLADQIGDGLGHSVNAAMSPAQAERAGSEPPSVKGGAESVQFVGARKPPDFPLPLSRFFGRDKELRLILESFAQPAGTQKYRARLITLSGMGGCGKTRLAIEAANQASDMFGDARYFVPLSEIRQASQIPRAIIGALQDSAVDSTDVFGQIVELLRERSSLVVLDNLEQIAAAAAPLVDRLLVQVPSLTCLVTSRRRLAIPGEREIPIAPLASPESADSPEELIEYPAVQLFVDRAQAARADFQITPNNAGTIASLCRSLDGVPLALELVAARAQSLTPAQMVQRLDQRFELLATQRADKSSRHRSLWAAIDWSYDLLTPELRALFSRLSVFRGGWTPEAAEEVCEQPNALEYLAQLRDRSLIVAVDAGDEIRFTMLETLREFATEQLDGDLIDHLSRRHADYCLRAVEIAEPKLRGSDVAHWVRKVDRDHDNVRAALHWCMRNDGETGQLIAGALWRYWLIRGHFDEGREWFEKLVTEHPATSLKARARALTGAGIMANGQGDLPATRRFFELALAARREIGDADPTSTVLGNLGALEYDEGNYDEARRLYLEGLELVRETGNEWSIAGFLNNLGNVEFVKGDFAVARQLLEQSLALRRSLGDRRGIATSLNNLGNVAAAQGELEEARGCQQESAYIYGDLNDCPGLAFTFGSLGHLDLLEGNLDGAHSNFSESLRLRLEMNEQQVAPNLENFAQLYSRQERHRDVIRLLSAAARLRDQTGSRRTPEMSKRCDEEVERSREVLGQEISDSLWERGRIEPIANIVAELCTHPVQSSPRIPCQNDPNG